MQRPASQARQQQQQMQQQAPQHQQQLVAQFQQQHSPQQSAGSMGSVAGGRAVGAVNPAQFMGMPNGGVQTALTLSPAMQPAQQLQTHQSRPVQAGQDVLSFPPQYAYQQKPPTISQQQHSFLLQQQIALAAQNKATVMHQGPPDAAVSGTFTEDDLQAKEIPHHGEGRKG
jgi:hypothetical protein